MTLSDVDVLEPSILSCLKDEELFDTAIDGLIEITTSPESYKYANALNYIAFTVGEIVSVVCVEESHPDSLPIDHVL